jgi:hypothetical protein
MEKRDGGQDDKTDQDGLAETWRTAEQRRAADLGASLAQLRKVQLRRVKVPDVEGALRGRLS